MSSLRIEHGLLVCLLGPSGCGKTTTLRLIAGFVEPTGGRDRGRRPGGVVAGAHAAARARNMSMIFQSYALWPHMTVAENVAYGLTLRKLPRADDRQEGRRHPRDHQARRRSPTRYPGELSGGQQQRVALARALVVEPETLLLDEPLSNLDANLREEMRFEVRRLHDQYRYTTVYVTHDQSEAMTTADLIAVMNGGRIEQLGTPEDIYDAAALGVRRPLHRRQQRPQGQGARRRPCRDRRRAVALQRRAAQRRAREAAISIRQHDIGIAGEAAAAGVRENVIPATVARNVFLGNSRDYMVGARRRHAAARRHRRRNTTLRRAAGSGCTCRRNAAACWSAELGKRPTSRTRRKRMRAGKFSRRDVLKASAAPPP